MSQELIDTVLICLPLVGAIVLFYQAWKHRS